jgi:AcrR family transcriptional regulator
VRVSWEGLESLDGIQRSRLVAAAARVIDDLGYSGTTVGHITARARVSRRTFYELFANREECFAAVLEEIVGLIEGEIAAADLGGLEWRERMRGGLWAILCFLDREPALARVCVVQALRGGPDVLARREEILAGLAGVVDEGRSASGRGGRFASGQGGECSRLTAEGVVGAVVTILYARLLSGGREPLRGLLGELMGIIVLPYLGASAARREQARPAPSGPAVARGVSGLGARAGRDPLQGVQMRLTYRTARVLESVAEHPGASNRWVADHAGIADQGQVSRLLARLQALELLTNTSGGHSKGEPNAWVLTAKGETVARSIRAHAHSEQEAA